MFTVALGLIFLLVGCGAIDHPELEGDAGSPNIKVPEGAQPATKV